MTDSTPSQKHAYVILTPLKPHFYIVKLGFTGIYIIFLISARTHNDMEAADREGLQRVEALGYQPS